MRPSSTLSGVMVLVTALLLAYLLATALSIWILLWLADKAGGLLALALVLPVAVCGLLAGSIAVTPVLVAGAYVVRRGLLQRTQTM